MNAAPPAGSALATPASTAGPTTPKKGPPKFKQRQTRTFKSKAPKPGQKGYHCRVPMGGIRRHGAQRSGQIRHYLNPAFSTSPPSAPPLSSSGPTPFAQCCRVVMMLCDDKGQIRHMDTVIIDMIVIVIII
uniref:Retinal cone rhodopsin-sensitive cGMP 3',5'-cyclic phosphodiesterase subunit gamma n=1 Tax=Sinocyclocheilus grahami TaxID=75366 RepID=A0A672NCP8_SINGR